MISCKYEQDNYTHDRQRGVASRSLTLPAAQMGRGRCGAATAAETTPCHFPGYLLEVVITLAFSIGPMCRTSWCNFLVFVMTHAHSTT